MQWRYHAAALCGQVAYSSTAVRGRAIRHTPRRALNNELQRLFRRALDDAA
jgi:hypothetical protein